MTELEILHRMYWWLFWEYLKGKRTREFFKLTSLSYCARSAAGEDAAMVIKPLLQKITQGEGLTKSGPPRQFDVFRPSIALLIVRRAIEVCDAEK